jgi:hypothetical protein
MIQFLLLVDGIISFALAVIAAISVISGILLFLVPRFKAIAPFIVFVPSLGALFSIGSSWGLGYLIGSLAKSANSVDAWNALNALSLWAWPAGLLFGGIIGIAIGFLIAWAFRKRQLSHQEIIQSSMV